MEEGYLLCVFGDDIYYKLSKRMINNIRKYDNIRKICILTDNIEKAKYIINDLHNDIIIKLFDYSNHPTYPEIDLNINWNKFGLYPKIFQSLYTPFKKTMFCDVDMFFLQDFTFMWNNTNDDVINIAGISDENNKSPSHWHWGYINDIMHCSKLNLPQIFSTIMIYNINFSEIIKNDIDFIMKNLNVWKVKKMFRNGYTDEIIYSLILGKHNIKPNRCFFNWISNTKNCDTFNKKSI